MSRVTLGLFGAACFLAGHWSAPALRPLAAQDAPTVPALAEEVPALSLGPPESDPGRIFWNRDYVTPALYRVGLGEATAEQLVAALRKEDRDTRVAALMALAQVGEWSHLEAVRALLSDKDWWVRYAAVDALQHITQRDLERRVSATHSGADTPYKRLLVAGLTRSEGPFGVSGAHVVRDALGNKYLRPVALRLAERFVAGRSNAPESWVEPLVAIVNDPAEDRIARDQAAGLLRRTLLPQAVQALRAARDRETDEDVWNRINAHLPAPEILPRRGMPPQPPEVAANDRAYRLRENAKDASRPAADRIEEMLVEMRKVLSTADQGTTGYHAYLTYAEATEQHLVIGLAYVADTAALAEALRREKHAGTRDRLTIALVQAEAKEGDSEQARAIPDALRILRKHPQPMARALAAQALGHAATRHRSQRMPIIRALVAALEDPYSRADNTGVQYLVRSKAVSALAAELHVQLERTATDRWVVRDTDEELAIAWLPSGKALAERGFTLHWDPDGRWLDAIRGKDLVRVRPGNREVTINGRPEMLPAAPRQLGGLFVPEALLKLLPPGNR